MIVDIFFGLIDFLLNLIPDINFTLDLTNGLSALSEFFAYVDNVVSVGGAILSVYQLF